MGDKVISYPCYPVEDKKHGFTGVGTPQSPCDVGGLPALVVGPTYGFTDGKNAFVPEPPRSVGGLPALMHGPVLPIQDHGSKYTPQNFGCSGYGINTDKPKELHGPGNRDIGDRNAAIIAPGKYVPEKQEKPAGPILM